MAIWNYWKQEKVRKVVLECLDHSPLEDAIRVRVIDPLKDSPELIEDKKLFSFKTDKDIKVYIVTDRRTIQFVVPEGYVYNGANIPKCLWSCIGGMGDNAFLTASMVHDYMLQFKELTGFNTQDDIRLTSLIFREVLKTCNVGTAKSNIMASAVHGYQYFFNRNAFGV